MKKIAVICLLVVSIAVAVLAFGGLKGREAENASYLRVHIRADSNEAEAQAVKYKVRDKVVEFLTPAVAECESKAEAMQTVSELLGEIEGVAQEVLRENGFAYGAKASLKQENFPTRVYENLTLEAGVYDALILELGSGKGDNWWCVVYPPLCFAGGNANIIYKSKIAEIIRKFFGEYRKRRRGQFARAAAHLFVCARLFGGFFRPFSRFCGFEVACLQDAPSVFSVISSGTKLSREISSLGLIW